MTIINVCNLLAPIVGPLIGIINILILILILIMYNVQDYSVPFDTAVLPVICEGWHFTVGSICMTASFHLKGRFRS